MLQFWMILDIVWWSPEAHWIHLLIHGVLHLLGYDHETDVTAATMEQLEINILEKLGFPNPYLVG